jgi:hypothetical protein
MGRRPASGKRKLAKLLGLQSLRDNSLDKYGRARMTGRALCRVAKR